MRVLLAWAEKQLQRLKGEKNADDGASHFLEFYLEQ